MRYAYALGLDLHAVTAARMLGIPPEQFDNKNPKHAEARQKAKGVNFGIIYGCGAPGLVAFARCLALEEAGNGITVNVVAPGDIREKTLDRARAFERPAHNPRGRAGSYEDVADAVRFLVARERDFITGAVIEVTGGLQTAADT